VICAKLSAQVSGRNYPAAASAKDHDPFSFFRESHVAESQDALDDYLFILKRSCERRAKPRRFRRRCSRHNSCSRLPSMVSSLPNPEETRKNQIIRRSERSLSHSIHHRRMNSVNALYHETVLVF